MRLRRPLTFALAIGICVSPALADPVSSEPVADEAYSEVEPPVSVSEDEDERSASSSASDADAVEPQAPPAQNAPQTPLPTEELTSLPTGVDKSGVTSRSISVPKGSGTIQGMEESFSAQLSTGIATFSVPFALPAARGGAQPNLGLSYSSSGGFGLAGAGWSVGVPFIARQTDRGVPSYDDQSSWQPNQDRFVFNGGQELVPICVVSGGGTCSNPQSSLYSEVMPVWASGWQYFRPRVEGSFLRFFWSPDHLTWRVQDKSGVTMELGVPLDGTSYTNAIERNPDDSTEVYRWHLVREYDTWGNANPLSGSPTPLNVVVFRYFQQGGTAYLSDIYDTPPSSGTTTAALAAYAHHTRLVYASRPDPTHSYRSGWRMEQNFRLARVDVASKTFNGGASDGRAQVRRYHLDYDPESHISLLASVQVEGRCAASEDQAPLEVSEQLPEATGCSRLPAMKFEYSHVTPFNTSGGPSLVDLDGYEGFDERLHTMTSSPPHSIDEELTDLFDVNADSLPDVLVTALGVYGPGHGVFFNSTSGAPDAFASAQPVAVNAVLGGTAGTLTLKNLNVAALDVDGDAISDLVHMPKVKTYAVYSPAKVGNQWAWQGRLIGTSDGLSPKIDFGKDGVETQVMDVDFDGLVDVVITTGTEVQTYFSLGRFPGGDGRFGQAIWTSATTATLTTEPVRTCVPWSATPIRFSDPDVKTADMNGDGIADIVRVRKGDIRFWPGRGNGFWGTGKRDDCLAGSYGANRHVVMASSPQYSDIQGDSLRLDDVNGDGLTDLVQVRFDGVDVWLNVDGKAWTPRHIIANTPASPSYANRVRLVDMNGSGTRDILWGNASSYKYMDLAGGSRPSVLVKVDNGLGKTTALEYSTSATEMIGADKTGTPWTGRMPTSVHVVKRVTESDNLTIAGKGPAQYVTEYSYRDPVFEGRQREFRGFRSASARRVGDANSPTDITDSTFLLGECADETPTNGINECAVSERWRDNPKEALKGLPVISEKRNESGVYLSTDVTRYRLRRLYTGLDGRDVRHAFELLHDTHLYDTASFIPPATPTSPVTVEVELAPTAGPLANLSTTSSVTVRSSNNRRQLQSESAVDVFGNRTSAIARGCVDGCAADDEIITSSTPAGRPSGDPTGWLWRTTSSVVHGSVYDLFLGALQQTYNTYNAQGALTTIQKDLDNTVALDRFHATGASVAGAPSEASADGLITWTNTYDTFGNLTRESGPNSRCRDVSYDDDYAHLPDEETLFLNGCGSTTPIPFKTDAAYDRSLGLATLVTDIQTQPTKIAYDSFGRLSSLTRPHPLNVEASSPLPSVKLEYLLPTDLGTPSNPTRYSIIHTLTHDGALISDDEYLESWSYVDGLGRTLVTLSEADTTAAGGDDAAWIASGQVTHDGKGAVFAKYLDHFYPGPPTAFPFAADPATLTPPVPRGTQSYDAFGRPIFTTDLDGTVTLESVYHALSTDLKDAADLQPGNGTYATATRDGHGRTVSTIERFRESSTVKERETATTYLPTGEPLTITRKLGGTSNQVMRWMRYDSLGRLVVNVEPNASAGFTTDYTSLPGTLKAWRYAYNDSGDLVGTSDARGCGVNFKYDKVGRLQYEDYSPCESHHLAYGAPNLAQMNQIEVYYHYDSDPEIIANDTPADYFLSHPAEFLRGRLVAVFDMGAITVSKYDGRGRVTGTARKIAKPSIFASSLAARYTAHWFEKTTAFDSADREVIAQTGASVSEVMAPDTTSTISTIYSRRGTVASATSSYGDLVASTKRTADGLVKEIVYGDAASTTTSYSYDERRRLESALTTRSAPAFWTYPAVLPSSQLVLQDDTYEYDIVSNPTAIGDLRTAAEWPSEAKPVDRRFQYDDFYRLTQVDYSYNGGSAWTSPFAPENGGATDPRLGKPVPQVSFTNRIASQTYAYDWLGNGSTSDDDAHGFYDRSLGTITNSSTKPYQLTAASNETTPGSPINKEGHLTAAYDAAGNLTELRVLRNGACIPSGAKCNNVYEYRWDEVGRLVRARRWDVTAANINTAIASLGAVSAEAVNTFDANDERVIEQTFGPGGTKQNVFVFDTLDLRRTVAVTSGSPAVTDYPLTKWTEVPYLFVNGVRLARVAYNDSSPEIGANATHVFLEIGDHLGSTSVVIDRATGELVERGTYQPYGSKENDYRPTRWQQFREDYGFTGKEEDVQVGLTYFGKRFLSPYLNRWVSADPFAVHVPGEADLNVYAYVHGQTLKETDPLGLQEGVCTDNPRDEARSAGRYNASLDLKLVRDTEAAYERFSSNIPDGATAQEIESLHARYLAEVSYLADQSTAAKAAVPKDPALRKAYNEGYRPQFGLGVARRMLQALAENWVGGGKGQAGVGRLRAPVGVKLPKSVANGVGYKSFEALKAARGPAGKNKGWHHVVEQNQEVARGGPFAPEAIHNTKNTVAIDNTIHEQISTYYSQKQPFTGDLTVRQYLAKQSFEKQYAFGLEVLRMFGVKLP